MLAQEQRQSKVSQNQSLADYLSKNQFHSSKCPHHQAQKLQQYHEEEIPLIPHAVAQSVFADTHFHASQAQPTAGFRVSKQKGLISDMAFDLPFQKKA